MSAEMDKYIGAKKQFDNYNSKANQYIRVLTNAIKGLQSLNTTTVENYLENGKIIGSSNTLSPSAISIDAKEFPAAGDIAHLVEDYNKAKIELEQCYRSLSPAEQNTVK